MSSRAKSAIGLSPFSSRGTNVSVGESASFVVLGSKPNVKTRTFRQRRTIQELVYDAGREERTTYYNGVVVSRSE